MVPFLCANKINFSKIPKIASARLRLSQTFRRRIMTIFFFQKKNVNKIMSNLVFANVFLKEGFRFKHVDISYQND